MIELLPEPPDRGDGTAAVQAALLMSHPCQHFSPGLRLLAEQSDIDACVFYWNPAIGGAYDSGFHRHVRWSADLHSGYAWWAPPVGEPAWRRCLAAARQLKRHRPEVVLSFGWASPICRAGIAYARVTGTPLLYFGDTNWQAAVGGRWARMRRLVLGRLFRRASGALSTGTFNREFYIAHGMPPDRIFPGVYPTDVDAFRAAGERQARQFPDEQPDRPIVIGFAGKLTQIKAPGDLIEAVADLPSGYRWELRIIGAGPLRPRLESLAAERGIGDRVAFLGFRNTDEMPSLMSAVHIMVMPSHREPRGLVAIEAMSTGAATVVSSATGLWGSGDVVEHGVTGLVYPAGDVAALTACLRRLIDDAALRNRLATAGRARAHSYGPRDFAATTAAALVHTARRAAGAVRH